VAARAGRESARRNPSPSVPAPKIPRREICTRSAPPERLDRWARGRPPGGPAGRERYDADEREQASGERWNECRAGTELAERLEQALCRPEDCERAREDPDDSGRQRDESGLERVAACDGAWRRAERPEHADRPQAPLHVGCGRSREHHHCRADRNERERDEERDHDPRRLVDQRTNAVARHERQLVDAEAGGASLCERDVEEIGLLHPEQSNVDRTGRLAHELTDVVVPRVEPGTVRQREGDIVWGDGDADDAERDRRAELAEIHGVSELDSPFPLEAALDHDLAARAYVTAGHDRVSPPATSDPLHLPVIVEVPLAVDVDALLLEPERSGLDVREGQRSTPHVLDGERVEARNRVRQAGSVEPRRQAVGDSGRRSEHRCRGSDAAGRQ